MALKSRYQEKTKEDFTEKFNELASLLPEKQALQVTVTDVDLTGRSSRRLVKVQHRIIFVLFVKLIFRVLTLTYS